MKVNPIIFVVIGVIVLGGLFFLFKPKSQSPAPQNTQTTNPQPTIQTSSPTPESNVKSFELVIQNRKIVSGPETIKVNVGDEITIKVTVDEDEEFHIHGYDKFVDLEKGKQAELAFTANLSGRFIFELENSKTDLGAIEVQPKQ